MQVFAHFLGSSPQVIGADVFASLSQNDGCCDREHVDRLDEDEQDAIVHSRICQ